MSGLFNWRTLLRGIFMGVGTWLAAVPCPVPEDQCFTTIIGSFLVMLGAALGSSAQSVRAASNHQVTVAGKK